MTKRAEKMSLGCESEMYKAGESVHGNVIERRWTNGSFTRETNSRDVSRGKGEWMSGGSWLKGKEMPWRVDERGSREKRRWKKGDKKKSGKSLYHKDLFRQQNQNIYLRKDDLAETRNRLILPGKMVDRTAFFISYFKQGNFDICGILHKPTP